MLLSKSDYIHLFRKCPLHLWVAKHRPEEWGFQVDEALQWKLQEGNRVEQIARASFPDGRMVDARDDNAGAITRELIELGVTTLFQATADGPSLLAKADVFQFDPETERWNILEVKSSTQVKELHVEDLCFQRRAFQENGFAIGKLILIHINRDFVRRGEIQPDAFFSFEDITATADAMQSDVDARIDEAITILDGKDPPTRNSLGCTCIPADCDCSHVCFPSLPKRPVFSLPRFNSCRAHELFDQGIRDIADLPSDERLTETQELVVNVIKANKPFVDNAGIRRRLLSLQYPLYFLDYESFAPAVPIADGYRPYQQMVFQYSLHILSSLDAKPMHREFLADSLANPAQKLTAELRKDIGDTGTVIVWNKSFETNRNKELAAACPEHAQFLEGLNNRIFDLMLIFRDQLFVHPQIGGSYSIKDVLPVLIPELSYANLNLREGTAASLAWNRLLTGDIDPVQANTIKNDLFAYCRLDTFAMLELFRFLSRV